MAAVVLKGLVGAAGKGGGSGGIGDQAQQVVEVAKAGAAILDIIREENAKAVEQARKDNNESNACKVFIDNALILIKGATLNQYNVIIATDIDHDVWWQDKPGPDGQIQMDLLQFTSASGKDYSFQAMVFDTGQYIRHGKWEPDHWTFFGDSKSYKEAFTGTWHVEFSKAQPKQAAK